jgi:hypothetical protein
MVLATKKLGEVLDIYHVFPTIFVAKWDDPPSISWFKSPSN